MNKNVNIGEEVPRARDWEGLRRAIRSRTSISRREFARLVKNYVDVGLDYAVWRLHHDGLLRRPSGKERGLYIVVHEASRARHILDPFEAIQSIHGEDVVFCYGTALYLHGLSRYGRLTHYYVVAARKPMRQTLGQITVLFVKARMRDEQSIIRRKHHGHPIRFTDLERTIIECINRPKYAQGWENVVHALDAVKDIRVKQLLDYIKELDSPTLAAKTGVVLDHYKEQWRISESELIGLQQYIPRTPARFKRGSTGTLNKRWNIIVPPELFAA